MIYKAPNIYEGQILSAELHLNGFVRAVNHTYGCFFGVDSLWFGHNTHYYHDQENHILVYNRTKLRHFGDTWYLWVTIELKDNNSNPNPEDNLIVEYDYAQVPVIEKVVEGKYVHIKYDNNPSQVHRGKEVSVMIYSNEDDSIDNDAIVYPPYELNDADTTIPLFDFISGTPTIDDWNDLTKAVNNVLAVQATVNPAFLATKWGDDLADPFDTVRYSQVKHNDFLLVNYQVRWPDRQPDPAHDYAGSNLDIKFSVNDSFAFHHGVYLTIHQGADPIRSSAKIYASVGDLCRINSKSGVITEINKLGDYDYEFVVDWDDGPPDIVQIMDSFTVWSPVNKIDIKIRQSELEGEYRPFNNYTVLVDLNTFGLSQGETYTVSFNARKTTPPIAHPQSGETIVGFIGESSDIVSGDPVIGWMKMEEWKHLDPVPGSGDKAINNIVENIRLLQSVKIRQRAITRRREHIDSHWDLCVNHRYRWLGVIVLPDDDGKLPDSKIIYHNGKEWVEEKISYSGEEATEKIEYIDLSEFVGLMDQGFYVLKKVNYAYELDFIAEV